MPGLLKSVCPRFSRDSSCRVGRGQGVDGWGEIQQDEDPSRGIAVIVCTEQVRVASLAVRLPDHPKCRFCSASPSAGV